MKNLKTLRKNLNLTQQDCANYLGLSKTTLCYYEQGRMSPSIETTIKIADYFNCSVDYLLGHETQGIVHLDAYTPAQQKLFEMIKVLNADQALFLTGYISDMLKLPFDQVKPARPW